MAITKAQLIEHISSMSVLELSELVKELEEKFGVSAAAAVAAAPAGGAPAEAAEEKTEFDLVLKAAGSNKIAVIKEVRALNSTLGLKEAKDLVEAAGDNTKIKEAVSKEEAAEITKKFKAAGAEVVAV
jgi:large subunit ribosomal protein L7/L12